MRMESNVDQRQCRSGKDEVPRYMYCAITSGDGNQKGHKVIPHPLGIIVPGHTSRPRSRQDNL